MLNYNSIKKRNLRKNKKAQDQKSKILSPVRSKSAQEEIAGFAIILVLLGVILVGFLAASLHKKNDNNVEDYEISAYIQSALQQTARCETEKGYLDIRNLIIECTRETTCLNGDEPTACEVLEQTLQIMLEDSWGTRIGEKDLYKGYELAIVSNRDMETDVEAEMIIQPINMGTINQGNWREGSQTFSKSGQDISIILKIWF